MERAVQPVTVVAVQQLQRLQLVVGVAEEEVTHKDDDGFDHAWSRCHSKDRSVNSLLPLMRTTSQEAEDGNESPPSCYFAVLYSAIRNHFVNLLTLFLPRSGLDPERSSVGFLASTYRGFDSSTRSMRLSGVMVGEDAFVLPCCRRICTTGI